jgi:hypothetical protein
VHHHRYELSKISKLQTTEPTLLDGLEETGETSHSPPSSSSESSVNSMYALVKSNNYNTSSTETSPTFSFPYNHSLNVGSRALEAFVRPSPVVVAGIPKSSGFDMRSCTFSLIMVPFREAPPEDAPTEIFLPEYIFQDCEPEITISSGRWEMHRSGQVLLWWHSASGEQSIRITSAYTREGLVGTEDDDIEGWYYWNSKCQIM